MIEAMKRAIACFAVICCCASGLFANGIEVGNVSVSGRNTTDNFILINLDISWENSWRTTLGPSNWDAAWVFVKYRVGTGAWQHAWLNNTGHTAPAGTTIDTGLLSTASAFNATTNPGMGVFIYRSSSGSGNLSLTGAQLRWNYGANGLGDTFDAEIKVYAVEMVYVTQGAFAVGDGNTGASQFTLTTINTATPTTAPVPGGSLGGFGGGYPTGQTAPNASWPNGFNAFYCMKYKVTQQLYVDFLNTLTSTQAATLYYNSGNIARHVITGTTGNYTTMHPYVPCNFLSWADLAAILDWMALRPMTELEYEKACRGAGRTAVAGEYAWGSTVAVSAAGIINGGLADEVPTNATANCVFASGLGPLRAGCYATPSANREKSGATYYGIMEMSGTLWEQPITIENPEGKLFTGTHGNGLLTASGVADATTWPAASGLGSGNRGGCYIHSSTDMQMSRRVEATANNTNRLSYRGGRGIRSAP
jgi:formylglycine-generating enzyme required for sulfatase activity